MTSQSRFGFFGILLVLLVITAPAWAQLPELYYYKFNETSGSVAADEAMPGFGATATLGPLAGWQTTAPIARLGAAALRPGPASADHVRTGATFSVGGSWTVETWIYETSPTSDQTERYVWGESNVVIGLRRGGGAGAGNIQMIGNGITATTLVGADMPNVWTHIALVYDSVAGNLTPYVNGVAGTAVAQPGLLNYTSSSALGLSIGGRPGFQPWSGYIDDFRFWNQARTGADILNNMNTELNIPTDDLEVLALSAPDDAGLKCGALGMSESVTLEIRNRGQNAVPMGTSLVMSYVINSLTPVVEAFPLTANLANNDRLTFTFAAPVDLSAFGNYAFTAGAAYVSDLDPTNDFVSKSVDSGGILRVSTFPYVQNFDNLPNPVDGTAFPPSGWYQDPNDGGSPGLFSDWLFRTSPTPSNLTGPPADHTTGVVGQGYYAYVEDDGNRTDVILETACLDTSALSAPQLSFWVYSENPAPPGVFENFLSVDVVTYPGQVLTLDIVPPIPSLGPMWTQQIVSLSPFVGQVFQLRFRGTSNGGNAINDIAIDDVLIFDSQPPTGETPKAGLALLDVNGSINGNGQTVGTGAMGPYFATINDGGTLSFTMEGEVNQPIIMLSGPLNVASICFGAVGCLDIGGAIDPMTGFPVGIEVIADGNSPTGVNFLFNTGPNGNVNLSFSLPPLPLGTFGTFQLAIPHSVFVVGLSNAVQITIVP